MEDARARRAVAMALNQPANDDFGVSKKKTASEPQPNQLSTPSVVPPLRSVVPTPIVDAPITQTPESQTRSKPRSRVESETRFASILMPSEIESEQAPKAGRRKPFLLLGALFFLALIAGAFYVTSQGFGPQVAQTLPAPVDPSMAATR